MNKQRRGGRTPDVPEGVSISIELTDYDIDATLNQFAKKLRDTADIIDRVDEARLTDERDSFMSCFCGMMLDFDHVVDPLRAIVRIETPILITEGCNPLYGGVVVEKTSAVEIFKDAYDLITKEPKTMTVRELVKLRAERLRREIEAMRHEGD